MKEIAFCTIYKVEDLVVKFRRGNNKIHSENKLCTIITD